MNPKLENIKILSGAGKEWSSVANEVVKNFAEWISLSNIEEKDFWNRLNNKSFGLGLIKETVENGECIKIQLVDTYGNLGVPILWCENSQITKKQFIVDAGLFLFYISSICNTEETKNKITSFIKEHLCNI